MTKTQEGFWTWFDEHETELYSFDCDHEAEREAVFDELASALENVHPELDLRVQRHCGEKRICYPCGPVSETCSRKMLAETPILKTKRYPFSDLPVLFDKLVALEG